MTSPAPMMALDDVVVLDLTQGLAGPFGTKTLADYGADVIKIEPPGAGDPARGFGPFPGGVPHPEKSGLFLHLNTNKRSLTLDITRPAGRDLFLRLAEKADIVVESFKPGTMAALGLGYEVLERVNPRLVMTSLSNYGQYGPYRDYRMSEITLFGGGAMLSSGLPDREPVKQGLTVNLFQGGYMMTVATLAAFYVASTQGQGQYVDVALFETAVGSMDRRLPNMIAHQYTGGVSSRESAGSIGFPYGVYPCADGYFSIVSGGANFPRAARMIGHPELIDDPRFNSPEGQVDPAAKETFELEYFLPWTLERTKLECLEQGQANGVLCGAVNTVEDVLASPHLQARGYWVETEHPAVGRITLTGAPFKMSESPFRFRSPAPLLGQHTDAVLTQYLGLSAADLAQLRGQGII
jgi:crotonobetainyl-CoA:carnitine CoA-transferase CaiB-like acyl-CoA transferase